MGGPSFCLLHLYFASIRYNILGRQKDAGKRKLGYKEGAIREDYQGGFHPGRPASEQPQPRFGSGSPVADSENLLYDNQQVEDGNRGKDPLS
jgi:hypothetical protein